MTAALAVLPGLDFRSEGAVRVPVDELRSKLGATAWHIWTILCDLRNAHDGVVHPSVGGIAAARGYVRTPRRAVLWALARLTDARLVRNIGWRVMDVPWRGGTTRRRVFVREVYGRFELGAMKFKTYTDAMGGPQWVAVVPEETRAWLAEYRGRGGVRPGAGRPRKSNLARAQKSNLAPDLGEVVSMGKETTYCPSLREGPRARARSDLVVPGVLGLVIGGGSAAVPDPALDDCQEGVPPYPGFNVVMPARVPPAPQLDPAASPAVQAELLVRAYRAAVEKRTGRPCHVLARRGSVLRSKVYKGLVAGGRALIEHGIAPVSWALWTLDTFARFGDADEPDQAAASPTVWRLPAKLRKTPPIGLVFSAARVAKRRAWFSSESTRYTGGRVMFGPRLTDLHRRWAFMRAQLVTNRQPAALTIATCFPPDRSYWAAVDAAKAEAQHMTERLLQRVARGECLWG